MAGLENKYLPPVLFSTVETGLRGNLDALLESRDFPGLNRLLRQSEGLRGRYRPASK
jgi:hypothetical protein